MNVKPDPPPNFFHAAVPPWAISDVRFVNRTRGFIMYVSAVTTWLNTRSQCRPAF